MPNPSLTSHIQKEGNPGVKLYNSTDMNVYVYQLRLMMMPE
jgi:hypothetical protein